MRCPGCNAYPQVGAFPPSLDPMIDDTPNDDPWWCPSCLAAAVLAAHDDDCRCDGCRPAGRNASLNARPMPMLLDDEDRRMLMGRVVARIKRDHPDKRYTRDDLRAAVRAEAEALVVEGGFVFQDGAFIRWPPLVEFDIRDFEVRDGGAA